MDDLLPDLTLAFNETFQMLSISTVLAVVGGLPLGFLIFVTDRNLFWQNRFVYLVSSVLVNIIRSVPFVILLVLLLPLTQFLLGNTIGPIAASVPLSVAAIAFMRVWSIARCVRWIKGLSKRQKRSAPARCALSAPYCCQRPAPVCYAG